MQEQSPLELIYDAHRLLSRLEETPHDYGTGSILFASELHAIVGIGEHPGCNLTELAGILGISKPAALKVTRKLERDGYVIKSKMPGNGKEVSFSLEAKGKDAMKAHTRFMKRTFGPLRELEARLQAEERENICSFLTELKGLCSWG